MLTYRQREKITTRCQYVLKNTLRRLLSSHLDVTVNPENSKHGQFSMRLELRRTPLRDLCGLLE